MDKRCQYLPFQDWSVKCKKMVDTGVLILAQLGKQVLVTAQGPLQQGNSLRYMMWESMVGVYSPVIIWEAVAL